MDLGLKTKRALVFGGSSGIGRGIAKSLANEGAQVGISARNELKLAQAVVELGLKAGLSGDLTVAGTGERIVKEGIWRLGGLDILVTNTGGPAKGNFESIHAENWKEAFQSLHLSVVESIKSALPAMRAQKWGRIVLVTSSAAKEPIPGLAVSNSLRAGLLGLVKSLSLEVAKEGITINALLPGYTKTERLEELGLSEEDLKSKIPTGRLVETEELGALVAFLSSDWARSITGQAFVCDGGALHSI